MVLFVVSDFWYAMRERRKKTAERISVRPTMLATCVENEEYLHCLYLYYHHPHLQFILEGYKARAIYHCALTLLPLLLKQGLLQRESYGLSLNLCHEILFRQLVREQSISQMHVLLERITYTMLAIDLGFHDSWQKIYLQRFDYIYSGNL